MLAAMNIVLIDGAIFLAPLREAGHNVLHLAPPESCALDLPGFLARHAFSPDLVFQAEHLARRLLLCGLPSLVCPKIFWAVDSHLNLWWHRYYARLFDAVLTPHPSLWRELPLEWRHPCVRQFTKPGCARPFKPHQARGHFISLVGVLNEHRHLRLKLAELLRKRWGVAAVQGLPFAEMLDLYDDSVLIPNESIAREVNFRLMETASCGAVPLTQDVGPDQDALFEAGQEMLVYRDAAELIAHIKMLEANPARAESIGRAAWERVQREHLPAHRVARVEQLAAELTEDITAELTGDVTAKLTGDITAKLTGNVTAALTEAQTGSGPAAPDHDQEAAILWLCQVQMHRSWQVAERPDALLAQGANLPQTPEVLAYRLRLLAEYDGPAAALPALKHNLAQQPHCGHLDLNLAASLIAVRAGDAPLALQFFLRQKLYGHNPSPAGRKAAARPETLSALCLAWADLLSATGRKAQLGLTVNSASGIPECAWTTLMLAQNLPAGHTPPDDLPRLSKIEALTANIKGLEFYHLGYLAQLCLAQPDDWRLQMRYAEACLQTFRLEEGLAERAQAEAKRNAVRRPK